MRTGALTFAALVGLVVVALGADVFSGGMPADFTVKQDTYHLAVICERWGAWLREGAFAAWLPEFGGGHPVHALWMYGFAHPAALLWALLPIELAYTWGAILHVAFGGAGIAAYLRHRGARADAAFVAGALYVLSEFVLVKIGTGGVNQLWALAWAAWVLRAIERAVAGERGAVPALGLWAGAALLAGHVQVWLFLGPFLVAHAVIAASGSDDPRRAFARVAGGGLLAAGLSALQWLPALELIDAAGERPVIDAELLVHWSAPAHVLAAKLLPGVLGERAGASLYWGGEEFDHEQAGMTGAWTLLLCLLALRRRDSRRMLWGTAAALGLVAAHGFHDELTGWINSLPLIGWSRTPARAQMLTLVGGAILAGHGLSDWIEGRVSERRLGASVTATVGALVVAALILLRHADRAAEAAPDARERVLTFAAVTAALVVAIPLLLTIARGRLAALSPIAPRLLLLLLGAPLLVAPVVPFTETGFLHIDWTARLEPAAKAHRIHLADFRLPYVERHGLRTFRRAAHVEPASTREFRERMNPAIAAWMDAGVTLVHPPVERGPPHWIATEVGVLPPQVAPRGPARLHAGALSSASDARVLDRLARGEDALFVDFASLEPDGAEPDGSGPDGAGPLGGVVRPVATGSPHEVAFDVEAPRAAWLFVTEKWYPGWEARLDGAPTPVYRANVAFRAVQVPVGRSRVTLLYRPPTVLWGAVLAGIALLTSLAGLSLARFRPPEAP